MDNKEQLIEELKKLRDFGLQNSENISEDLKNRFLHHPPKGEYDTVRYELIRVQLLIFAGGLQEMLPDSREKALAITKLEEAMFWANAAIARSKEEF